MSETKWEPIETVPRDGKPVLIGWSAAVDKPPRPIVAEWIDAGWVVGKVYGFPLECDQHPTHWMRLLPLPSP